MKTYVVAFMLSLFLIPVQAATVFTPSDGDIDILKLEIDGGGLNEGMFLALSQPDALPPPGIPLDFATSNLVQFDTPVLDAAGYSSFSIALYDTVDWHFETTAVPFGDAALLNYVFDHDFEGWEFDHVTLLVADGGGVQVIPIPAAAWLFGSGLLGLTAVARRKEAADTLAA